HERDTGSGDGGLTTAERQRLKELERENRELRAVTITVDRLPLILRRRSSTASGKNDATAG
ncbi:transposase, partial [Escherichia coli O157:H7 str. K6676]